MAWPLQLVTILLLASSCDRSAPREAPHGTLPLPATRPASSGVVAAPTVPTASSAPSPVRGPLLPEVLIPGPTVKVAIGQSATIDDVVTIALLGVLSDGRCPSSVDCAWSGEATLRVSFTSPGAPEGSPRELRIFGGRNAQPAGKNNVAPLQGDRVAVLVSLDPYPERPNQTIDRTSYLATFAVIPSGDIPRFNEALSDRVVLAACLAHARSAGHDVDPSSAALAALVKTPGLLPAAIAPGALTDHWVLRVPRPGKADLWLLHDKKTYRPVRDVVVDAAATP
ncbi:hypothetical protein [Chondromyces apiculatus]|uniref:hypothetical protein n=1 Tax=Chondromyces apiculatus TaxID=51 RepID=UPI0012DFAD06|nr:hypothetical protein [Chondromyces apiculatus]